MIENVSQVSYGTTANGKPLCIVLSEKERRLVHLLRKFIQDSGSSCTLRIAGGWVRDKLLGLPSDDLDVAIDTMTGVQLATRLQEYIKQHHVGEREHFVAVIQTNPDKSKHLETATTKIFGMHVDFVNLRSESYIDGSRIPHKMDFGTAEQDAFRRDITINCLFFNLNSLLVEDFTGHGLEDLKAGIIRTPLEPKTTFMDDPLRILRVVRFACRFGYQIVDDIFDACKCSDIRKALATKVSKERIGTELTKTLKGNNPNRAIEYFMRLHIADVIFSSPDADKSQFVTIDSEYYEWTRKYLERLMHARNELLCQNMELAYLCCCLLYYRNETCTADKKSTQREYLACKIVRHSLKLSNDVVFEVKRVFSLLNQFTGYVSRNPCTWNRRESGVFLRNAGSNWEVVALLAYACSDAFTMDDVLAFMAHSKENNLLGCWTWRPILNGNEIASILGRTPGPFLSPIIQELLEWQLEAQPKDKETAAKFMRARYLSSMNAK